MVTQFQILQEVVQCKANYYTDLTYLLKAAKQGYKIRLISLFLRQLRINSGELIFVERRKFQWNDLVENALPGAPQIILHLCSCSFPLFFQRLSCYVAQAGLELVASCLCWHNVALQACTASSDGFCRQVILSVAWRMIY